MSSTFQVTEAYVKVHVDRLAGWQVGVHEGFGDFVIDSVDVPKLCRNIFSTTYSRLHSAPLG